MDPRCFCRRTSSGSSLISQLSSPSSETRRRDLIRELINLFGPLFSGIQRFSPLSRRRPVTAVKFIQRTLPVRSAKDITNFPTPRGHANSLCIRETLCRTVCCKFVRSSVPLSLSFNFHSRPREIPSEFFSSGQSKRPAKSGGNIFRESEEPRESHYVHGGGN